jgi:hypothetical protein
MGATTAPVLWISDARRFRRLLPGARLAEPRAAAHELVRTPSAWSLALGEGQQVMSGVMLPAWPLVVENVVCVVLAGFILAMKLLPHHLRHAVADRIDPDVPSP